MCKSGDECIAVEKVCDNRSDCSDKSDEGGLCGSKDSSCDELKCDGKCHDLPDGAACMCSKGFSYNRSTKQCEVRMTLLVTEIL